MADRGTASPGEAPFDRVEGRGEQMPSWPAYLAVFASYVVLGLQFKSVFLNWIVGPLYLLVMLELVPRVVRYVRARA